MSAFLGFLRGLGPFLQTTLAAFPPRPFDFLSKLLSHKCAREYQNAAPLVNSHPEIGSIDFSGRPLLASGALATHVVSAHG